jgi:hypothetical protein
LASGYRQNSASSRMIGNGMPISQSSAPFPNVMVRSLMDDVADEVVAPAEQNRGSAHPKNRNKQHRHDCLHWHPIDVKRATHSTGSGRSARNASQCAALSHTTEIPMRSWKELGRPGRSEGPSIKFIAMLGVIAVALIAFVFVLDATRSDPKPDASGTASAPGGSKK